MIYMLKVFLLVAVSVSGLSGAVLLALVAWSEAMDYVRARLVMRRIAVAAVPERLRMSPLSSQRRSAESLRAA